MLRFLRIERPTIATLRLQRRATSIACWRRWTLEANEAIRMRPVRTGMSCWNASPTSRREPADVGLLAVHRRVVELPVARVENAAGRSVEHDRDRVRDRVRDAHEVEPEGTDLDDPARLGLAQRARIAEAVLVQLRLDETECEAGRDHVVAVDLAQEERQPADVVLVA